MSLAGLVFLLSEVLQVLDLLLARVVLGLGPAIQALDLLFPGVVLGVQLTVQLGDVCDPGLVVLLSPLLQGLDLVLPKVERGQWRLDIIPEVWLPETVLPLCGVLQSLVVSLQLVVVSSQGLNLTLAIIVSGQQSLQSVSQLGVETVPGIEGGSKIVLHDVCLVLSASKYLARVSQRWRLCQICLIKIFHDSISHQGCFIKWIETPSDICIWSISIPCINKLIQYFSNFQSSILI